MINLSELRDRLIDHGSYRDFEHAIGMDDGLDDIISVVQQFITNSGISDKYNKQVTTICLNIITDYMASTEVVDNGDQLDLIIDTITYTVIELLTCDNFVEIDKEKK